MGWVTPRNLPSAHSRTDARVNSQRPWQQLQARLYRFKPGEVPLFWEGEWASLTKKPSAIDTLWQRESTSRPWSLSGYINSTSGQTTRAQTSLANTSQQGFGSPLISSCFLWAFWHFGFSGLLLLFLFISISVFIVVLLVCFSFLFVLKRKREKEHPGGRVGRWGIWEEFGEGNTWVRIYFMK